VRPEPQRIALLWSNDGRKITDTIAAGLKPLTWHAFMP
jgi:hypothetical protein